MKIHEEKAQPRKKRETEQQDVPEAAPQDTPAADEAESTLAGIGEALADSTAPTEANAEAEMEDIIRRRYSMDLDPKGAEAEVAAWEQKYAHLGLRVGWCCGVPYIDRG